MDRGALCPCGVKGWVPDGPWGAPDGYGAGEGGIPETRPWLGSGVGSGRLGRVGVGPNLNASEQEWLSQLRGAPCSPTFPPRHHPAPLWFEGPLEGGFLDGHSARRCISQSQEVESGTPQGTLINPQCSRFMVRGCKQRPGAGPDWPSATWGSGQAPRSEHGRLGVSLPAPHPRTEAPQAPGPRSQWPGAGPHPGQPRLSMYQPGVHPSGGLAFLICPVAQ